MLWNMIKELQKGFVVVEFGMAKTTVKDQGDMSIIWKVSAQVALQAANSCCLLKKMKQEIIENTLQLELTQESKRGTTSNVREQLQPMPEVGR